MAERRNPPSDLELPPGPGGLEISQPGSGQTAGLELPQGTVARPAAASTGSGFKPLGEWLTVQKGAEKLTAWANRLGMADVDVYTEVLGATGDPHGPVDVTFEDVRARREELHQRVLTLREMPVLQGSANKFLLQFKKVESLLGTTAAKAAYDAALLPRRRQQLIALVIAACEPFCVNDGKLANFEGFIGFDWDEQQNVRQSTGSRLSASEWENVLGAIRQRYAVETQAEHMAAEFARHVKQAGGEVQDRYLSRRAKDLRDVFGSEAAARAALLAVVEREGGKVLVAGPAADSWKPHRRLAAAGEKEWNLERLQAALLERFDVAVEIANLPSEHKDSLSAYIEVWSASDVTAAEAAAATAQEAGCPALAVWYFLWATGVRELHVGGPNHHPVDEAARRVSTLAELEALIGSQNVLDQLGQAFFDGLLPAWLALSVEASGIAKVSVQLLKLARSAGPGDVSEHRLGVLRLLWAAGSTGLPLWDAKNRPVMVEHLAGLVERSEDCWGALQWCLSSGALALWLDRVDPQQARRARECAQLEAPR